MKLAEALASRTDLQRRMEQMRVRLKQSALVQEGEEPPEDPEELLSETGDMLGELEGLVGRINRTNLEATIVDGATLTEALARRDVLGLQYGLLRGSGGHGLEQGAALRTGGGPDPADHRHGAAQAPDGRGRPAEARAGHCYPDRQLDDRADGVGSTSR